MYALLNTATQPIEVSIYEEQPRIGPDTPYRSGWNDPAMLYNIAGIENRWITPTARFGVWKSANRPLIGLALVDQWPDVPLGMRAWWNW